MKGELEMDRLTHLSDEQHWVRCLDYAVHAETPETFKKRLGDWLRVFPDAAVQVEMLLKAPYAEWVEFRRGLQAERDKRFAGEKWVKKYGAILMPDNAIRATEFSRKFQAPWGATLIQLVEVQR